MKSRSKRVLGNTFSCPLLAAEAASKSREVSRRHPECATAEKRRPRERGTTSGSAPTAGAMCWIRISFCGSGRRSTSVAVSIAVVRND